MGETRARSHGGKLQRAEEEGRTLQGRRVQGAEGQPWERGELAGEIAMAAGLASCAWLLRVGQGAGGGWRYAGAMDAREELQLLVPLVGFLCTTRMPERKELLRHGARRRDGVGKKMELAGGG